MSLVIDASVALAWCFEDEASDEMDALLEIVRVEGAVVPSIFHLELSNVLVQAERKGRIKPSEVSVRLALLARLPIAVDVETNRRAWKETLALARAEKLTTYDAAYLELAVRTGSTIASLDKAIVVAAGKLGVPTH